MFTGIVAAVGRIEQVVPQPAPSGGVHLHVTAGALPLSDVAVGDSIAIRGACMTVVALGADRFEVDVSAESLACTCGLDIPGDVNLEKSLRLSDALGGHLVSGHVDGIGSVVRLEAQGESSELVIRAPSGLAPFLTVKGSITVDGVSLTVNRTEDQAGACKFSVNLIAHTLAVTTLRKLRPGSLVNLEVDMIARYVVRVLALSGQARVGA